MTDTFRAPPGPFEQLLASVGEALRSLSGAASGTRPAPGGNLEGPVSESDRRLSSGLMRVNHTGEICAQALYSGQALAARETRVRDAMRLAASEERDHLAWCRQRLAELGSRPSVLDPFWYAGSFAFGVASGLAGDRWSLGFLAETEAQVESHLEGHLERLPADDRRSREIVAKMREDESRHGAMGRSMGGTELPFPVRLAMRVASKVMTRSAYWV
jgi:ubiquinone biosynthesis monooxygenase Coq7